MANTVNPASAQDDITANFLYLFVAAFTTITIGATISSIITKAIIICASIRETGIFPTSPAETCVKDEILFRPETKYMNVISNAGRNIYITIDN